MWAHGRPVESLTEHKLKPADEDPATGLLLLRTFCETGILSLGQDAEAVLLAKELLHYRVLDVFAQIYCAGVEPIRRERLNFPFINALVSVFFMTPECTVTLASLRATPASRIGQNLSTPSQRFWRNLMDRFTYPLLGLA